VANFERGDSYVFQRAKYGLILVLNRDSYLMAEYWERTGIASWQRIVNTQQRTAVEKKLREEFPPQALPKNKASRSGHPVLPGGRTPLGKADLFGLQPFGAVLYDKTHLASFLKGSIASGLDRREMDKDIFAVGAGDEAKSLRGVKPFDSSCFFHIFLFLAREGPEDRLS
jgi:hypothetical protein